MNERLAITFEYLSTTGNEAAVPVLAAALESRYAEMRKPAIEAILSRRSTSGHRLLLRRLHLLSEDCRRLIKERRGHMSRALRDAILDADPQTCANGCQAVLWFREYDLLPTLINAVADQHNPNAETVQRALLELCDDLFSEPVTNDKNRLWHDTDTIRRNAINALETAAGRFAQHRRREIVESFLTLADRDNAVLQQILGDPRHPAFLTVIEMFSRSRRPGVIGLLLSLLDVASTPSAALSVIGNRQDGLFLHRLFEKIAGQKSAAVKKNVEKNLKKMASIGWLRNPGAVLGEIDETDEGRMVELAMLSGAPRQAVFDLIAYILDRGRPGGREAAAEALGEFNGAHANALVLKCLDDVDPRVQAKAAQWLRNRGIPGAFARLTAMLDSSHATVREAARAGLPEYNMPRYLRSFDTLDEETRRGTGVLVKKVDLNSLPLLASEMESPMKSRRLRALAAAQAISAVAELEADVIALLDDDDHRVRVEAARTLAQTRSQAAVEALHRALGDSSPSVQEAARESLEAIDVDAAFGSVWGGAS